MLLATSSGNEAPNPDDENAAALAGPGNVRGVDFSLLLAAPGPTYLPLMNLVGLPSNIF
jgi:hypothetical protein